MVKRKYSKKPQEQLDIAKKRILKLFLQAEQVFPEDPLLANRYVEIARKISMKLKMRIPSELKKRFCKNCYCYLVPSVNCRVRLQDKKLVYFCKNCKHFMRFPYKK